MSTTGSAKLVVTSASHQPCRNHPEQKLVLVLHDYT